MDIVAYIGQEKISEIQENTDIVDFIGQYVTLSKQGKDYLGLCPFHNEKTPSFHVSQEKQVFHCFGCGKSGNIFQFSESFHHLNFVEAVKEVANFSHITIENLKDSEFEDPNASKKARLIDFHEKAMDIYHHLLLHTAQGKAAYDYLTRRGITREVMETFKLGYAPDNAGIDVLVEVLKDEQLTEEEYEQSGLFSVDHQGKPHDRFKNRLMVPIFNQHGRCIAFSGRTLTTDADIPKYLNSKETLIFNKSQTLYHYHQAIDAIRQKKQVILLEGYMDVIALYQAGIEQTVASMGTSLTTEQIQLFKKYVDEVVISYDGDKAGIKATLRAIDLLEDAKIPNIRILMLPDNLDPDEYLRKYGTEALQKQYTDYTLSKLDFFIRYYRQGKNLENEQEKTEYLEQVLEVLSHQTSIVETDVYIQQLVKELGVSESILYERLNEIKTAQRFEQAVQAKNTYKKSDSFQQEVLPNIEKQQLSPKEKVEQKLIYRSFYSAEVRALIAEHQFYFPDPQYEELYVIMEDYCRTHYEVDESEFYNWLDSEDKRQLFYQSMDISLQFEQTDQEIEDYMNFLKRLQLMQMIQDKQKELTELSRMGNHEEAKALSVEILQLIRSKKEEDSKYGTRKNK